MPVVSVIVPIYNVEPYLHQCLDSILSQTFTNFECILVDDHSPDNCPVICDEYAHKDSRIKVIHKTENEGLPQARKTGLENSSGEYIQFVDGDDYVESDMIEKMYNYAISNNFDMVCCDWFEHKKSGDVIHKKMPSVSNDFVQNIKYSVIAIGMQGAVWNKFTKQAVYQDIEFPKDNYIEDRYIVTQILFYSKNIGYLDKAFYHYMYNQNSLVNSPQKKWNRYKEEKSNLRKLLKFLKKNNGKDLSVFEPELTKRINSIKERKKKLSKKEIVKGTALSIFPITVYNILKWFYKALFNRGKNGA